MDSKELFENLCRFACENLTFEEYRSIPLEEWYKYVREHYKPIPLNELEIGKEYNGVCRNAHKAVWDGKVFWYTRYKFGSIYNESINHYENDDGYDVFVPVKYV